MLCMYIYAPVHLSSGSIVVYVGTGRSSDCMCLFLQSFVPFIANQSEPYGSPNKLPLLGNLMPTATATTPDVNFPDVSSGGIMDLANATTNFALRFVGARPSRDGSSWLSGAFGHFTASLDVVILTPNVRGFSCRVAATWHRNHCICMPAPCAGLVTRHSPIMADVVLTLRMTAAADASPITGLATAA